MAHDVLHDCPVCHKALHVTRLHCPSCGTTIEGDFQAERLLAGKTQGSHGSMLPGLMWVDFELKYIREGYKHAFPPIITAEPRPMRHLQVAQYGGGPQHRRSGTGKA